MMTKGTKRKILLFYGVAVLGIAATLPLSLSALVVVLAAMPLLGFVIMRILRAYPKAKIRLSARPLAISIALYGPWDRVERPQHDRPRALFV